MRWLGIVFLLLVVCNVEAATWEVDIDGGTAYILQTNNSKNTIPNQRMGYFLSIL